MALYHHPAKIIKRSAGRSVVAAAAYRAREDIEDERQNKIHKYARKKDLVYKEIILPTNASKKYKDRAILWNEVEKKERRHDSQLAREIEVALPNEISQEEYIILVKEYVIEAYVNNGMIADLCIHDKKDGNPHAHILLTMREINKDGELGNKNRAWNDTEYYKRCRKLWADKVNFLYAKKGIKERISEKSFEERGIEKIATVHLNKIEMEYEKQGKETERGKHNKQAKEINKKVDELEKELSNITQEKGKLIELIKTPEPFRLTDEQMKEWQTKKQEKEQEKHHRKSYLNDEQQKEIKSALQPETPEAFKLSEKQEEDFLQWRERNKSRSVTRVKEE